jgi:hypothetical protein
MPATNTNKAGLRKSEGSRREHRQDNARSKGLARVVSLVAGQREGMLCLEKSTALFILLKISLPDTTGLFWYQCFFDVRITSK